MEFVFRPREVNVAGRRRIYQVLEHPGSVAIVALREGRIGLVRQFRAAAGQWLWEVPAGTLEPGEPPERAAHRELEEETGWKASRVQEVAQFYLAPGYATELMHLLVATELHRSQPHPDEGELIDRVEWFTLEQVSDMARRGEIRDAKTLAALWWAERLLANSPGSPPQSQQGAGS